MKDKRIAITGGGIAGLTLAIALQRHGFNVTVHESAKEIRPLGAGITLAANAMKAFNYIGIGEEVLKVGKVLKTLRIKDKRGNLLSESNAEEIMAKFGVINSFAIHRADLHDFLLQRIAPGTLHLNKNCIDFDRTSNEITLYFQDGSSVDADYLIACDGIHSLVRKKLMPSIQTRYAGYTCWRAVIDNVPENIDMDETSETWGAGRRFGIVPLTNNRIYWFACLNAKQNDPAMKSLKVSQLKKAFEGFHFPVEEILAKTTDDKLIWNDIIDIPPVKHFAFGNVLLLGDAAHATTPNLGQGACMAIEDVAVLSSCLQSNKSVEEAFISFERMRIKRTTSIVNQSWRIGRIAQAENSFVVMLRDAAMKMTPASVVEKQIKFIVDVSF